MIKVIDEFLEKRGFIRRSKIQDLIARACESDRNTVIKEYKELIKRIEKEMEEKHFLDLSERDAENKRLMQRLVDANKKIDDARKAYNNYKGDVKGVNHLISDVIFQIKRLFDKSGEIYQSFISIQDEAENYLKKLTVDDEENKKLLGISH